jgi:adenylyltransferase/sulfurtransferase
MEITSERYARQIILNGIGIAGQQKIQAAAVLIVGIGGLGSNISQYLTGAGIGKIGIVDFDTVSATNLHRQIIYNENDIDKQKALCAKKYLEKLNTDVQITTYNERFTDTNAKDIASLYDIIIDGSDNMNTRYTISDCCIALHKPYVYGAVSEFGGCVSVFNYKTKTQLTDLYPRNANIPSKTLGIFGMVASIIGSVEAMEAIKIITGVGDVLDGKLWTIDTLTMKTNRFNITK